MASMSAPKGIGVLTSGGDSQGMNAGVRSVVRVALHYNCPVFLVHEGYQGLVDGGDLITEAKWADVSGIIERGGTFIGSARCKEFRERHGRLRAAQHLVEKGINNLVVIGGDGSLTGANIFKEEWPSLIEELEANKVISKEQKEAFSYLNIVGMVGSIDNDFCGTDMTIGTDSALHRILEAADDIRPTAFSHQRTFILEVMGRHCGYIALVAALTCEADFVFIPEWPPEATWPDILCKKLAKTREMGQRLNIIIVAEGAIDREGNKITSEMVRKVASERLKQDARVTVLGHVQRGGVPSAYDRILASRMGAEAAYTLLRSKPNAPAEVMALRGNEIIRLPLMECVLKTQAVGKAMDEKRFSAAVELRGSSFKRNLETYHLLFKFLPSKYKPSQELQSRSSNLAVLNIGAPAAGMNAAVNSFVRNAIIKGHRPFGVLNGMEGLICGNLHEMSWGEVNNWVAAGGSKLGTKRTLPQNNFDAIAETLRKFDIHGMLIIGGYEGFHALLQLEEKRNQYVEFCIPMVMVPATISNNVPGSHYSLGSDTALNEITSISGKLRQSASGTKRRVFVIETHGGFCGYLATLAGLSAGADASYIFEEKHDIRVLLEDLDDMKEKMNKKLIQRGLILRNEKASANFTTEFITNLYAEEGKGTFSSRSNILGHIQQGGRPSVFDRNAAIKMAGKATVWLDEQIHANEHFEGNKSQVLTKGSDTICVLGLVKSYTFTPVSHLAKETDFDHRMWRDAWWMRLRNLMKVLAGRRNTEYEPESKRVEHIDEEQTDNGDTLM